MVQNSFGFSVFYEYIAILEIRVVITILRKEDKKNGGCRPELEINQLYKLHYHRKEIWAVSLIGAGMDLNSGDMCRKRSYSIGNDRIFGYGTPAY